MKKPKISPPHPKDEKEIVPLNHNLFNEFQIEELETRFETDPMILTHLFELGSEHNNPSTQGCGCNKIPSCPNLECGCKGGYVEPPICEFSIPCSTVVCGINK